VGGVGEEVAGVGELEPCWGRGGEVGVYGGQGKLWWRRFGGGGEAGCRG